MTTPWRYYRTGAPDLDTLLAQRAALVEALGNALNTIRALDEYYDENPSYTEGRAALALIEKE